MKEKKKKDKREGKEGKKRQKGGEKNLGGNKTEVRKKERKGEK